ncbi:ABC transporter permease [Nonomuraea sp. NPDC005983]|uniref:ABC transporter permease n=1 Tax=Nonomuraea sp. NPDC005983 TaxID=3155595 RepID=UPI0033B93C4E
MKGWKVRTGIAICAVFGVIAIVGPWLNDLMGLGPWKIDYQAIQQPPSAEHWLGTTAQGQDVLAQMIAGTRNSVLVGVLAAVLGVVLAVLMGVPAGFFGGRVDAVLSFFTNMFLVMPVLPLILVVAGYVQDTGPITIALIIGVFGWAPGARTLRAQTMSLRQRDFVMAMRMLGETRIRLIVVEVLPHLAGWLSAMFLHMVLGAVLAEAGLAFLGISSADSISWGTIINQAQQVALLNGLWWWFVPPGLCIALLGTATGLINFGIDEVMNPRLRTSDVKAVRKMKRVLEGTR